MTLIPWIVALTVGGVGGALNAAVSDHTRLFPSVARLMPGATRVVRIGVFGNVVTGATAVACVFWALTIAGSTPSADSGLGLVLLAIADLFIAFVSARWVTNEVDKLVLRKAVCKAVSAPAAHPDTIGDMELAPADAIYAIVDQLLPRRAGHR